MSELFDKEVNAQKENLKTLPGLHKLLQALEKVYDENERKKVETKKNNVRIKMLLMEGSTL